MSSTRDSLAELYLKDLSNDLLNRFGAEASGVVTSGARHGFQSGWDALAKLVEEEIYHTEFFTYEHYNNMVANLKKLVRE